jgi:hypothetical protein
MRGLICLTPSNDVFQLEHKEILFGFKRIKLHNYFDIKPLGICRKTKS